MFKLTFTSSVLTKSYDFETYDEALAGLASCLEAPDDVGGRKQIKKYKNAPLPIVIKGPFGTRYELECVVK